MDGRVLDNDRFLEPHYDFGLRLRTSDLRLSGACFSRPDKNVMDTLDLFKRALPHEFGSARVLSARQDGEKSELY